MWLERIVEKLQDRLYRTVGEFVSDVQLIFTNCNQYNQVINSIFTSPKHPEIKFNFHEMLTKTYAVLQKNAEYLAMGNRLKELFEEEFKKVFNIQE